MSNQIKFSLNQIFINNIPFQPITKLSQYSLYYTINNINYSNTDYLIQS